MKTIKVAFGNLAGGKKCIPAPGYFSDFSKKRDTEIRLNLILTRAWGNVWIEGKTRPSVAQGKYAFRVCAICKVRC